MNRFLIPMVAVALLTAACGTASGSTGSAGASQGAVGGDHVPGNAANAPSQVSEVTKRPPNSGVRAATKGVTAPTSAQIVPPAENALYPLLSGNCVGTGIDPLLARLTPKLVPFALPVPERLKSENPVSSSVPYCRS